MGLGPGVSMSSTSTFAPVPATCLAASVATGHDPAQPSAALRHAACRASAVRGSFSTHSTETGAPNGILPSLPCGDYLAALREVVTVREHNGTSRGFARQLGWRSMKRR